jgi:hypothetical protein
VNLITLADAMDLMRKVDRSGQPVPFSISFVTWNRRENKGGELKHIHKASLIFQERGKHVKPSNAVKKPLHWQNATFNIRQLGSDKIIKVHRDLITRVNDLKIVWHIHG